MNNAKPIIAISGDSGERYLDTLFSDSWLENNNIDTDMQFEKLLMLIETMDSPIKVEKIESNYRDDLIKVLGVPPYHNYKLRYAKEVIYT